MTDWKPGVPDLNFLEKFLKRGSQKEKANVYYIAYGSNLNEERMKRRCPGAVAIGTSAICGYRLLFRHSLTGVYATIEPDEASWVPVAIYRMTQSDEERLDRFEGYPRWYQKQEFLLPIRDLHGKMQKHRRRCIAYVMPEYRMAGVPSWEYYGLLDVGYCRWGFPYTILFQAVEDSIGRDRANKWLSLFYGGGMET